MHASSSCMYSSTVVAKWQHESDGAGEHVTFAIALRLYSGGVKLLNRHCTVPGTFVLLDRSGFDGRPFQSVKPSVPIENKANTKQSTQLLHCNTHEQYKLTDLVKQPLLSTAKFMSMMGCCQKDNYCFSFVLLQWLFSMLSHPFIITDQSTDDEYLNNQLWCNANHTFLMKRGSQADSLT